MKIIRNRIIPFPGYKSINLFGILFARPLADLDQTTINHESIHSEQIKETLFIGFYIWYVFEWVIRSVMYWDMDKAYKNMLFEKEAYQYENEDSYITNRKHYTWLQLH